MKLIIKLFSEITIKSKPVRKQMIAALKSNISKIIAQKTDKSTLVGGGWDHLFILCSDKDTQFLVEKLVNIPGIANVTEILEYDFTGIDDLCSLVLDLFYKKLINKTFKVEVKRIGVHSFTSTFAQMYIGGFISQNSEALKVDLHNPETLIKIEIRYNKVYIELNKYQGLGGFPLGSLEHCLSLISGGFDSSVASYLMLRRGYITHFCFFNLGGVVHEIGVAENVKFLWEKFGSSHKMLFISVPFEPVVAEILAKVDSAYMGVVLKRMMMKAASKVATKLHIPALVTGEALSQVSSQTLTNLRLIDKSVETLIIRPLISTHKQEIIDIARKIGTANFAEKMPEYCGVISQKPTTKGKDYKLEHAEAGFDYNILEHAVNNAYQILCEDININAMIPVSVEITDNILANQVVIDIRSNEQKENKPFMLIIPPFASKLDIEFFKLNNEFKNLDNTKTYLLYCDNGIMSKIQAHSLHLQGFYNVSVLKA